MLSRKSKKAQVRALRELEEDILAMFAGQNTTFWRDSSTRQSRTELAFVEKVLGLNGKCERQNRLCKLSTETFLLNLGERTIVEERVRIMRRWRAWYTIHQKALENMIEYYEDTVLYYFKQIASSLGFYHASDTVNRFKALSSLKKDSQKELEEVQDAYFKQAEHYQYVKATLGKQNLLLSNKIAELNDELHNLENEVRELDKIMQQALKFSTLSHRQIFQAINLIENLHTRIVTERGLVKSEATNIFQKVEEIGTVLVLMTDVVKMLCEGSVDISAGVRDEEEKGDGETLDVNASCVKGNDGIVLACDALQNITTSEINEFSTIYDKCLSTPTTNPSNPMGKSKDVSKSGDGMKSRRRDSIYDECLAIENRRKRHLASLANVGDNIIITNASGRLGGIGDRDSIDKNKRFHEFDSGLSKQPAGKVRRTPKVPNLPQIDRTMCPQTARPRLESI